MYNNWIEKFDGIVCPYCGTKFKDEIFYVIEYPKTIRYCPYCGKQNAYGNEGHMENR